PGWLGLRLRQPSRPTVGQSTKVAGGVGMTAWSQRAGVVLLAVTAWTAPGSGEPVTPGRPDALAQKLAAAAAHELPDAIPEAFAPGPPVGPAGVLSDAAAQQEAPAARRLAEKLALIRARGSAGRPDKAEIAAAA